MEHCPPLAGAGGGHLMFKTMDICVIGNLKLNSI